MARTKKIGITMYIEMKRLGMENLPEPRRYIKLPYSMKSEYIKQGIDISHLQFRKPTQKQLEEEHKLELKIQMMKL